MIEPRDQEKKEKRMYRMRVLAIWIFLVAMWCLLQYIKPAKELPEKDEVRLEPIEIKKTDLNE